MTLYMNLQGVERDLQSLIYSETAASQLGELEARVAVICDQFQGQCDQLQAFEMEAYLELMEQVNRGLTLLKSRNTPTVLAVDSVVRETGLVKGKKIDHRYRGRDVHAYSDVYRRIADQVRGNFPAAIDESTHKELIGSLKAKYKGNKKAQSAISKMQKRFKPKAGGYMDPDLNGLNVSSLLLATWTLVMQSGQEETFKGFQEVLQDIGGTCVQGDSHRLLNYYVALLRG